MGVLSELEVCRSSIFRSVGEAPLATAALYSSSGRPGVSSTASSIQLPGIITGSGTGVGIVAADLSPSHQRGADAGRDAVIGMRTEPSINSDGVITARRSKSGRL